MNYTIESNDHVFAMIFESIKDAFDAYIVLSKAYIHPNEIIHAGNMVCFPIHHRVH
jgi:hypothetical protein